MLSISLDKGTNYLSYVSCLESISLALGLYQAFIRPFSKPYIYVTLTGGRVAHLYSESDNRQIISQPKQQQQQIDDRDIFGWRNSGSKISPGFEEIFRRLKLAAAESHFARKRSHVLTRNGVRLCQRRQGTYHRSL